jgi:hypothetical protein
MNQLDIALAARAHREGHAKRTALLRHRWLSDRPIAVVLWQLGAEPFSAAAVGFGQQRQSPTIVVAGDPRNRDLAFAALLPFAQWFNPLFEAPAADRETVTRGTSSFTRSRTIPQIIVANETSVDLLGRIGRRLAYLRRDGPQPAPLDLVRLGQHLLFLARHSRLPGQQVIVALTDLMNRHWATAQSPGERLSLAAVNAYIAPPSGVHGFVAAAQAERDTVGPTPSRECDEPIEPLVSEFNRLRAGRTEAVVVAPLLKPIKAHYRPLVARTWMLLWDCRERELAWPEAPSVARRLEVDRDAYTQHIDWVGQDGRRRTRQTARQAAMLLRRLEGAQALLDAEEACDDPVRMVPFLLENKAVQGEVVRVDVDHKEMGRARRVRRPLVTIRSSDPCLMPVGKELWWTACPDGNSFEIHDVQPAGKGSVVTLKLNTSTRGAPIPRTRDTACFSIHKTSQPWLTGLPYAEPWTHRAAIADPGPQPIEDPGAL